MEFDEVQPVLLSAIACNRVIFDRITGMASVIDIVLTINAPKYPARHGQIVFFCELTNGHGTSKAQLKLVDVANDEKVIIQQEGDIQFKDVRQVVTLAMSMHGVLFPHPGEYRFQLFAAGRLLAERRIICQEVRLPDRPASGPTRPPAPGQ